MTQKLFAIKGVVQHYAWGGKEFIPKLLNQAPTDRPCAEYWLGAHPKASSMLANGQKLDELISADPANRLGVSIAQKFGRLPYLFKVLDVHDMLSIQVHPTKHEAEKGYARENDEDIPLDANHRNYKDDNHKPEIMVALSEFWLLHGFKPLQELRSVLLATPELIHLVEVLDMAGYRGLYQSVMEESAQQTNAVLRPLIDRILPLFEANELKKSSPDYWAAKAYKTFCSEGDLDKGIYSIYFFNIVHALPGEAVFQDAGIPHAYMEGQNMELMANSDNVLRGGLTPKHVDVPELLKHVAFEATIPNILKGTEQDNGIESVYQCPVPDFELSQLSLTKGQSLSKMSQTAEILMVVEGKIKISEQDTTVTLQKGEACVLLATAKYEISAESATVVYRASAPVLA